MNTFIYVNEANIEKRWFDVELVIIVLTLKLTTAVLVSLSLLRLEFFKKGKKNALIFNL